MDLSGRPYVQALMGGAETVWSGGLDGLETGQLTVAFGRVIRSPDGEPRAFLIAAFYSVNLAERLPFPERGNVVLIDQDGRLLFSSGDPDMDSTPEDVGGDPAVAAALAGQTVALRSDEIPFEDGKRFGSIVPVPAMNWALGYTRSQANLNASLRDAFVRDLAVLAIISLVSVSALIVVARQISRPLSTLAAAAKGMKEGHRLPVPRMDADPDVAKLQKAFVEMRAAVEEREARLAEHAATLETLARAAAGIASELEFERTVQAVTEAATRLTEAAFGAFCYNVTGADGESYQLYTLSGAGRESFDGFGMPRNTAVFGPTFRGEGVIRSDDITKDDRYGQNDPHYGMPKGHLPVRSYLAVPVYSGKGDVLGGLFFGHPEVGVFREHHELLAQGIAAWATIALDNARLYEESREIQAELMRANRAKDEFLGLVSHEMRTPITIIAGSAGHLLGHIDRLDQGDRDQLLRDVYDSAERLTQLVQNLLSLARLEQLSETEKEPVMIGKVIQKVLTDYQRRRPGRAILVDINGEDALVLGSQLYLEQVLTNLVSNADKYSPAQEPIDIRVRAGASEVVIDVLDRGSGLSAEDSDRLFEPYYRGTEARKRATGFGLGLAVCKGMVEAMGGGLQFAPRDGGGSRFTVVLPALDENEVDEPAEALRAEEKVPA